MKILLLSLFSLFATLASAAEPEWHNVVSIHLNPGDQDFINAPLRVLRPFKGDLVRFSSSASCPVQLITIRLKDVDNRNLGAELVRSTEGEYRSIIYKFNEGSKTVNWVGLRVNSPGFCDIWVDQAETSTQPPPPREEFFQPLISDCEAVARLMRRDFNATLKTVGVVPVAPSCGVYLKFLDLAGFKSFVTEMTKSSVLQNADFYIYVTSAQKVKVPLSLDLENYIPQ